MSKKARRALTGFLVLFLLVLFLLPMPHGGSLGGNMVRHVFFETGQKKAQRTAGKKNFSILRDTKAIFYQNLQKRFAAPLPFVPDEKNTVSSYHKNWQSGMVGDIHARLNTRTGMIYGARTGVVLPDWTTESWEKAKAHCAQELPAGSWSLPTETELEIGKRYGLLELGNEMRRRWMASYIRSDENFNGPAMRIWGGSSSHVYVMCIGRSEKAPLHGYIRDDVDNDYNIISK